MDNYFDLYELPHSFHPDPAAVKKQYYALSRQYHPDRYAAAGAEAQAEALRMAAINNTAYKTLSDPDSTMAYLLQLNGQAAEGEKYTLPPAFLMQMMDLNDVVTEYEMAPDDSNRKTAFDTLGAELQAWDDSVQPLLARFERGERDAALLAQIKDFYYRKKYLLRIKDRLDTFAAG